MSVLTPVMVGFFFTARMAAGAAARLGTMKRSNQVAALLVVRYEDMRSEPGRVLGEILAFTGTPGTAEEVQEAVDFAAYENMKKMEQDSFFKGSGARVKPGDKDNPQSFKVRKAKVGGYRDHFNDEQCAQLEAMVAQLDPLFGYGSAAS